MPINMKLWQVKGKDLQEVNCEALHDEQRLQDWLVKDKSILSNFSFSASSPLNSTPGISFIFFPLSLCLHHSVNELLIRERIVHVVAQRDRLIGVSEQSRYGLDAVLACQEVRRPRVPQYMRR